MRCLRFLACGANTSRGHRGARRTAPAAPCHDTVRAEGSGLNRLCFLVLQRLGRIPGLIRLRNGRAELADPLADGAAHLGQPPQAEDENDDEQDDEQLPAYQVGAVNLVTEKAARGGGLTPSFSYDILRLTSPSAWFPYTLRRDSASLVPWNRTRLRASVSPFWQALPSQRTSELD